MYSNGLVTYDEKSIWQPCQSIEWLGIIWNSVHGTIHITGKRSSSIEAGIDSLVKDGGVRVCGDAVLRYFWCAFAVIFILTRGIAVSKH